MNKPTRLICLVVLLFTTVFMGAAQTASAPAHRTGRTLPATPAVCSDCIRAHMEFLASDALRGRGSATPDELVAASYIASQLMQYGIEPAGDNGTFLQRVPLVRRSFRIPPQLRFASGGEEVTWKHGLNFLALHVGQAELSGPLQKIRMGAEPLNVQKGAFVFLTASPDRNQPDKNDARSALRAGAAAVIIPVSQYQRKHWQDTGEELFLGRLELANPSGTEANDKSTILMLDDESTKTIAAVPDGTTIRLISPMDNPQQAATWNVLGQLKSRTATENHAVVLSAHLDHLGVGVAVNGDSIYNGADDDASGTTAVLELARVLTTRRRPTRTVIIALFGSEELGDLGSEYFLQHSPLPLDSIGVNLNFEMIGRPDPAVGEDTLWMTGWSRSNLGPELVSHGAKLVADPHPEQHFFRRSDNYALAEQGVVAQTISSFGLHPDYHQPSDDLAHIDFKHMDESISSLIKPILWLINSNFTPEWNDGEQP